MKRRLLLAAILPGIAVHAAAFLDGDHEGQGKHNGRERYDDAGRPSREKEHVRYFRPEDRIMLARYYPVQNLPPGLRKKYARTGAVPPGWQTRVQPLPRVLVERLPPPPPNCERGYVDGYAVVYNRTTRVILDTVDLINAVTAR